MKRFFKLLLLVASPLAFLVAPPGSIGDDNLDGDLLKELDEDLLEGLEGLPDLLDDPAEKNPKTDSSEPTVEPIDSQQTAPAANPLLKLSEMMLQAKQRIEDDQTADDTQQLQRKIVEEMATLIAQLQEQKKQNNQGGGSASQNSQPKDGSQTNKPGGQGNAESQATNPSESTDRVGSSDETEVEKQKIEAMLSEIWGQLPDRVRKQMQESAVEKVLPKYEKIIEEFYKRLAEERQIRP